MLSAQPYIDALSTSLGRTLSLSAEGTIELQFEGGLAVAFEAVSDNRFYLYTVLGPVPGETAGLRRLLEAQCFGMGTGDASFAVDPIRDELLLMRPIEPSRWQPHEMPAILAEFIRLTARWNESTAADEAQNGRPDAGSVASGMTQPPQASEQASIISSGLIQGLRV